MAMPPSSFAPPASFCAAIQARADAGREPTPRPGRGEWPPCLAAAKGGLDGRREDAPLAAAAAASAVPIASTLGRAPLVRAALPGRALPGRETFGRALPGRALPGREALTAGCEAAGAIATRELPPRPTLASPP